MGVSIGAQSGNNEEYVNSNYILLNLLTTRIFQPWLWSDFIYNMTSMGREWKQNINIFHSMTRNVINKKKSEFILNKTIKSHKNMKRFAFLDLLLDRHINENSLSIEELFDEVNSLMFAANDSITANICFTLYLLGSYPDVQKKVSLELESIFGEQSNRDITSDDMKKMHYLECVIKESLRMYPPGASILRELVEDIKIGDYLIPKGETVWINIEALHYDPQVFPEPNLFKPERFEDYSTSNAIPFSYIPFSGGPRSCIGKRFVMTSAKLVLSKIMLKFELRSIDKLTPVFESVYHPKSPLKIKFISKN